MMAPGSAPVGWSKRWKPWWQMFTCAALVGAVSVLGVLLRRNVPVEPSVSRVDTLLFVRGATFLAHGQWLGPFDQFTLIKGPGYPAFIALMYMSGVPLVVGEQLTYLLAAAAVAGCVWVVTRRRGVTLVAYVVLALDPVNFSANDSRLLREGWYASLCMLFVAIFFLAVYGAVTRVKLRWLLPVSVLAGLSGAAFWLCREEGLWILPTIVLVALGLPFCLLARWYYTKPRPRLKRSNVLHRGGRLALVWAVVGMALIAPVTVVTVENLRHYGAALTNDLVSGQFARAYADWTRVEAGTPSVADPLVLSQREAVYRVSPAARQLVPYLEDPHDLGRRGVLALRNAAASAGHFHSESDAQRFFGELDAQIQAGCASGQLSCTARLPTQLQSLQRLSSGLLFTYLRHWGEMTLTSSGFYDTPIKLRPLGSSKRVLFMQIVRGLPSNQYAADDQMSRFSANIWPYRLLSRGYRLLLPCLLVMALIGVLLPIVRPRWPQAALSVLSGAFVLGVLSRLLFVALLDTTLAPTAGSDIRYLLPAHAFLIAFGVVGTAQLADALWTRIALRRGGDQPTEPVVSAAAPVS